MKKIVAALLSTATIVGIMATGTIARAEQVIDGREGETSGDVLVRGIIGEFDNTTPGPNPEDLDQCDDSNNRLILHNKSLKSYHNYVT